MVSPSVSSTIAVGWLDQGKCSGCHSRESCPFTFFARSDPGPILTLQPSPLLSSCSLRKTERCPFNFMGLWKRAARS